MNDFSIWRTSTEEEEEGEEESGGIDGKYRTGRLKGR